MPAECQFLSFFGTTTEVFPSSILPCIPNSRRTLLNAVILCRVFLGMRSLICPFVLAMRSLITVDKNTCYVGYAMFSLEFCLMLKFQRGVR